MLGPRPGWLNRLALALVVAVTVVTAISAASATAAPNDPPPANGTATDDEGGTPELRKQLADASRGYLDAKAALEASTARQAGLAARLRDVETRLSVAAPAAAEMLSAIYRTGGSLQTASVLLAGGSPGGFVDRAARLKVVAGRNERLLRELADLRAELAAAKSALDAEVANQERQLATMAKRKQEAERALAAHGGQPVAGPPPTAVPAPPEAKPAPPEAKPAPPEAKPAPKPAPPRARPAPPPGPPPAQPAPRRPNGTWPPEACKLDDPTTGGCLTARTRHALQQARAAGFTRYAACFRRGGNGEHPKGRACDFAAQPRGFGGVATGGDRAYGNNLARYFVANAGRLGVLYVIWFEQIWIPSSGWRAYRSGRGDPSSDHTNHVHLSMY